MAADTKADITVGGFPSAQLNALYERVGKEVYGLACDYTWFHHHDYPIGDYEAPAVAFAEYALRLGWTKK